jgi:hypothetical protein
MATLSSFLFFFHFPVFVSSSLSRVIACDLDLTQEPNQTNHLRSDTAALPITDYLAALGGDQIATKKKSSEIKKGKIPLTNKIKISCVRSELRPA